MAPIIFGSETDFLSSQTVFCYIVPNYQQVSSFGIPKKLFGAFFAKLMYLRTEYWQPIKSVCSDISILKQSLKKSVKLFFWKANQEKLTIFFSIIKTHPITEN